MSNTSLPGVVQSAPSTSLLIDADTVITADDSTAVFFDSTPLNDLPFQHYWPSESMVPTRWRSHINEPVNGIGADKA